MPSAGRKPPKRAKYSPETRAAAEAALLAGQSVSQVAREYSLPKGTVSNWRRSGEGVHGERTQKDSEPGKESIGDLLTTLLETNIRGLIAASAVMQDPAWLREQDASQLGVFLGITHDKVVRMLEAMDRSIASPLPGAES